MSIDRILLDVVARGDGQALDTGFDFESCKRLHLGEVSLSETLVIHEIENHSYHRNGLYCRKVALSNASKPSPVRPPTHLSTSSTLVRHGGAVRACNASSGVALLYLFFSATVPIAEVKSKADKTSSRGTNTDGVLLDVTRLHEPTRGVLAYYKAPTTPDVSQGIEDAVREILHGADVPAKSVSSLSIGTTAFINAVLEADGRRLAKVAVIRLCGPYTKQCPPFVDFPPRLRALTQGHVGYVDGGLQSTSSSSMSYIFSHK